jgi:hypothetical protein
MYVCMGGGVWVGGWVVGGCVCVCVGGCGWVGGWWAGGWVLYMYLEAVGLTPFRSLVSFSEFARALFIDRNALREQYVESHHLV